MDNDDEGTPPVSDNVMTFPPPPPLDQAAALVKLAERYLNELKSTVTAGDPSYCLSEGYVDFYIRCDKLCKDSEFSHQTPLKAIVAKHAQVIKDCKYDVHFLTRIKARRIELDTLAKAKRAEVKGAPVRLTFEECQPGQYATYSDAGLPLPNFINAQLVFRDLEINASFNLMNEKKTCYLDGREVDIGTLRNLMWNKVYVDFPQNVLEQALDAYCRRFTFHPILDYLESIRHLECKGIIDSWLTITLGAENNELNREIGKKMLLAMVTRAYKPGAKFDQMVVLEGLQGAGKSTFLEILAGTDYFNSGKILSMSSKEQMEALNGRWVYESADLVGHGKADVDTVKAFLSATSDNGRWAYAVDVRDRKRTAIIVGTTNKENYLLDETGNRRIWPVACMAVPTGTVYDGIACPNEVDLKWLRDNRDHLFREALQLYDDHYDLVLPRNLWPATAKLQETRMADVPGADLVADVWGFTEHEGLHIVENKATWSFRACIWTQDIITQLYPSVSGNHVIGRAVKSAMLASKCNGIKWTPRQLAMASLNRSGYVYEVNGDEKKYKAVMQLIADTRAYRKKRDSITDSRM